MHAILLFAFLQVQPAGEPMRSGCAPDDEQIATISASDKIQVIAARAGEGPKTCYKVVINKRDQANAGYVLGESLPAVQAFVRSRELESKQVAEAQARMALVQAKTEQAGKDVPKPRDPNLPSRMDEFSWHDIHGKAGSLSGLGGKVTLVTFWPPKNMGSREELNSIMPLYNEFHRKGLAAVGVAMDPNPSHMAEVLDDTNFSWPQVPDREGLAARYHVNSRLGETFVLDASHRVVAAGPMGPEIEKAVRELLAAP